ncbi:hypothetical protein [Luteolibacter sp. LG18]|uniref:hypothetical protein n=1 Tax=Luteolibacter sp. LG18 TaxID=2819286 RepID=UPI002B2F3D19|nr:hypothetical protein llg_14310 [Luteolibacter sp. LG18]
MNMMTRLSLTTAALAGGLLLTSCDPYGPPIGWQPSPYDVRPQRPNPQRGDGYGDPYGGDSQGYSNPYGGSYGGGRGDGYNGGSGDGSSRSGDPYGSSSDGGSYTENPPSGSRGSNPPSSSGSGSGSSTKKSYPTATKTANPNRVLSPYPPYNVIDVEGIKSGKLAKDPSTGEVFRVP